MDYRDNPLNCVPRHLKWSGLAPPNWSNFSPPLTGVTVKVRENALKQDRVHATKAIVHHPERPAFLRRMEFIGGTNVLFVRIEGSTGSHRLLIRQILEVRSLSERPEGQVPPCRLKAYERFEPIWAQRRSDLHHLTAIHGMFRIVGGKHPA